MKPKLLILLSLAVYALLWFALAALDEEGPPPDPCPLDGRQEWTP